MYNRKYYLKRKEHFLAVAKQYRDRHKDERRAYHKEYSKKNEEELKKKRKIYYENNRREILKQKKEYEKRKILERHQQKGYIPVGQRKFHTKANKIIIKYYPYLTRNEIKIKYPEIFKNINVDKISARATRLGVKQSKEKLNRLKEINRERFLNKPKTEIHKERLRKSIKEWWILIRENNPEKVISIKEAGKKRMGENNPSYKDGKGYRGYANGWCFSRKELIRNRDKKCVICKIVNEIHIILFKRRLIVHHIDGDKDNHNAENLISLCAKCHGKINPIDDDMQDYFHAKLLKLIN